MADPDKGRSEPRKLFVAALPGFVIAFFILQSQTNGSVTQQYAVLAPVMLVSVRSFFDRRQRGVAALGSSRSRSRS
jgi:nitrite reductase (NADH) large subunit